MFVYCSCSRNATTEPTSVTQDSTDKIERKAMITAELGRALAVVKVTLRVNGNTQFSGSAPKNYWGDSDKIWRK